MVGIAINSIAKSANQFWKISQQDLMELGQLMEVVELVVKQLKKDKQRIAKK